ncbi:hypothetical protein F5J12DRAFT_956707 [Pisolithus orientalis]|uniref:uncharacterized protein n=1 Tax=Pisolithus orientalis TaxID=936130 RepID=UPI002224C9F5|nr:uncharacterized protein F5J12DRAFT_956707 [Pisolithus orientalis]KAI5997679.1 hypothetical protein F5J12DRAFT_956707 [Pisolithus orientalis]
MRETIPLSQTIPSMHSPMQELMSSLPQATSMQQMVSAMQTMQPMQQVQFLHVHEAHRVLGLVGDHRYPDPTAIARASLAQMNEMSRKAGASAEMTSSGTGSGNGSRPEGTDMTSGDTPFLIRPDTSWDGTVQTVHEGLQVFTLGHVLPRSALDDANGNWTYGGDIPGTPNMNGGGNGGGNGCADEDGVGGIGECEGEGFEKEESPGTEEVVRPTPTNPGVRESSSATSGAATPSSGGGQKLRVGGSTFVPGWAVPPYVLLVDDDAVSRRLIRHERCVTETVHQGRVVGHIGGEILFCTTFSICVACDVAGWGLRSYGLVQKHLMHLKVIQEMSRVPRIPCAPRLSTDNLLTDALVPASATPPATTTSTSSASSSGTTMAYSGGDGGGIGPPSASANAEDVDGNGNGPLFMGGVGTDMRIDPLAGMGLTEERYQAILKDLVNGDNLGVPEGFSFDMMEDEGIVDVGVGLSEGMSGGMGMGEKRGLEEEQDGIREVKRGRFEVLD